MAVFSVDLRGDKALLKALDDVGNVVAKKVTRKALREGAKIVQKKAKQLVPVRTGKLKRSIKVRAIKRSRGQFGVNVVTGTRKELGIPEDATVYYPTAVEAGTSRMPAQPYIRPAFDTMKFRVLNKIKAVMAREIAKAWQEPKAGIVGGGRVNA